MSTLYLHIGTPKTATTSIQKFCVENVEALHSKGYDYPMPEAIFPHINPNRNGHFIISHLADDTSSNVINDESKGYKEAGYRMLEEACSKYENVILSDEGIWHYTGLIDFTPWEELKKFCDDHGYGIRAIVYLRRQDELAQSWMKQQIQDGYPALSTVTWEEFIHNPQKILFDYYSMLERVSAVIGKDHVITRVFERSKFEGNGNTIQSDFLKQVGLEMTDDFVLPATRSNPSLSLNTTEVKRYLNKISVGDEYAHKFFGRMATSFPEFDRTKDGSEWFSPDERKAFLEGLTDSNRKLAHEYFGLDAETPFHTDIRDIPKWTSDNPYMLEDTVEYMASMILYLKHRVDKQQEQIDYMENLLRHSYPVRIAMKAIHHYGNSKKEK